MRRLEKDELLEIKAGGLSWGAIGIIAAVTTFIIGLIDGYVRILPCNE